MSISVTDRWGGEIENRMRFAVEIVKAIRAEIGEKFPYLFPFVLARFGA